VKLKALSPHSATTLFSLRTFDSIRRRVAVIQWRSGCRVATFAIMRRPSVDFSGYWQRHKLAQRIFRQTSSYRFRGNPAAPLATGLGFGPTPVAGQSLA
jgi:hypothetical protein